MKKYDVHVILGDKFHSVVIECGGFYITDGTFVFYRSDMGSDNFAWYPTRYTVIEEHKEKKPIGTGAFYK